MTATIATLPDGARVPDELVGVWDIDPVHSEVAFVVRHLVVSKVRGRFGSFSGAVTIAADPLASSVEATIDAGSVDTHSEQRDVHLRSGDFLDADAHPTITFRSTRLERDGERYRLEGELTIRGTTRPVGLTLEVNGAGPDLYGGTRAGFSATGEIDRQDFGVSYNGAIPGADNAMVLSDKVTLALEIQAVLRREG